MEKLNEIKQIAKIQLTIENFAQAAELDDDIHNSFIEFLHLFVDVEQVDGSYQVSLLHDAKERLYEWAAECVVNKPVEFVKEKFEDKEADWALYTLLTKAKEVYGMIKRTLNEEEYNTLIKTLNELTVEKKKE